MASFLCKETSTNIDSNINFHVIDDFKTKKNFQRKIKMLHDHNTHHLK